MSSDNKDRSAAPAGPTPHNFRDPGPWVRPENPLRPGAPPLVPGATASQGPAGQIPETAATAETAEELLVRLRRRYSAGHVKIELDGKRLMKLDSPVNIEAESNQWVYGFLGLGLVLGFAVGYKVGLATAAVGIVLYLTLGKALIRRRIARRVREKALADVVLWRKLWSFGGVSLEASTQGGGRCTAPKDNWLEFVRKQDRD
ncbi:MAG TPA: hypothetical protein VLX09_06565 [Stellaceae bacterium]|nr:hypothetical protein [Stellaceae bacterium]